VIARADVDDRVRAWGLREDVVEKDYVLGWVLWGIGTDPVLSRTWIFKGGTCLKKCYIETYRFSEDLDFTVLEDGPVEPEEVLAAVERVLDRVNQESGVDFSARPPMCKIRPSGMSAEGRLYYRGPRGAPGPARIKLDLTRDEIVVRPPVLRTIGHDYPDSLPEPAQVRCYGFEEVFAEKLRAMGERTRPRDLYDVVNLFRRPDFRPYAALVRKILALKCESRGIPIPSFESIRNAPAFDELEAEWANMLNHQLRALPNFEHFFSELPSIFAWLEGEESAAPMPLGEGEDLWTPPESFWASGLANRLEPVRFAAVNRLLVELGYQGRGRLIEPYSLRRTRAGKILLHALRARTGEHRSYRLDRIESARVTTQPFTPTYAIEFPEAGAIPAPPSSRRTVRTYRAYGR
jgi:predicted nucleotidyltransferase component of viral defense system